MNIFSNRTRLLAPVMLLFFIPGIAHAEDGDRSSTAVTFGWIAIGCGIVANLSLVAFKMARRLPIMKLVGGSESNFGFAQWYRPVLDFHTLLNSIGFAAGMIHGIMLVRGLDYISLSLAVVMTFSMASGIVLQYTHGRRSKMFSRLAHGQFVLAVLLLALVSLHVILMQGSD